MNAPKFTPGPWVVQNAKDVFTTLGAPNAEGLFAESNDGWQIADCGAGITFIGDIEHELSMTEQSSNARLIAAAPELYAQLEFAVKLLGGLPGFAGTAQIESMRAALAKATQS